MPFSLTNNINKLLARIILLLCPTLLFSYFLIWNANQYFSILDNQALMQTVYLGLGMLGSMVFFSFRFRFLPPTIILFLVLFSIYKGIDALSFGEFDTFFKSIRFLFFSILLSAGWLIGWGFSRLRYFSIFLAALFLTACILILSKQNELFYIMNKEAGIREYAMLFGPAVLYSFYIIFTSILIRNHEDQGFKIWWISLKRLVLFLALATLIFGGIIYLQSNQIKTTLEEFGGGGQEGENSMLKKNKDNTFDLKDYSKLSSSLGRSNELLFAAHIDHYFAESDVPNPLYLTAFYYSKFDTLTETFERDSLLPKSDLFEPDPSQISLFSIKTDSSVLKEALTDKFRNTVEIEVYKKQLSPHSFVAPSTSFFVQPITIEKDFQKEFASAYRAKSYISELNSAYFVYNANDPAFHAFQEARFEVLRNVKNYEGINKTIRDYYTFMPKGKRFDSITALAREITAGKNTPVDKVIAIRDYFLSKDENGDPLFSYTDNPGVPDIPSASKLQYFLFENRKGYCAYYAGATLFLLRSLGIPSRITVGFMTVDRSSQNKGWYWYYADQAHAWVQVYFPGYGWLDFDTTVGNDDAIESPQPDGTPPMQPPRAYFAGDGVIINIDTLKKEVSFSMNRMMYHDKERFVSPPEILNLDVKVAKIKKDSTEISLQQLELGDSITAVSYAQAFKKLPPQINEKTNNLIKRFPKPSPIDEIYLKKTLKKDNAVQQKSKEDVQKTNWRHLLLGASLSIFFLILLFLLLPRIVLLYFKSRYSGAKSLSQKSYWAYRLAGFYLHQTGFFKKEETPLNYASRIDKELNTNFAAFMIPYLKLKYAKTQPDNTEAVTLTHFITPFLKQVKSQVPFKKRFLEFFKTLRTITYF